MSVELFNVGDEIELRTPDSPEVLSEVGEGPYKVVAVESAALYSSRPQHPQFLQIESTVGPKENPSSHYSGARFKMVPALVH